MYGNHQQLRLLMTKITKQDILKLADLSKIEVYEDEIELFANQLQAVLSYAVRVKEIAQQEQVELEQNINVFAQDIVKKTDPEPLLSQAPDRQDNFFVVPKILDNQ